MTKTSDKKGNKRPFSSTGTSGASSTGRILRALAPLPPMLWLPDDLISTIASKYLSPSDQVKFAKTSKQIHHINRTILLDLKLNNVLLWLAQGKRIKTTVLLAHELPDARQLLLLRRGTVTDYSGRTFKNISAYEYAYWAKDTHACRMLEAHMEDATKAEMLTRIDAIERNGLTYRQHGHAIEHSKHFDFTPHITALRYYVDNIQNWMNTSNWVAAMAAWRAVGLAQRDVPAYVAQEHCRMDRLFDQRPALDGNTLPENLTFNNDDTHKTESWFPLSGSDSSGLGLDFAVIRGRGRFGAGRTHGAGFPALGRGGEDDLAAVRHLDVVSTNDLTQSRENLKPIEPDCRNSGSLAHL